jgi:hypothetical protein
MMCTQVPGSNKTNVVASHFWSLFKPFQNVVSNGVGNVVCLSLWGTSAKARCGNALVKFGPIEDLGWSLAFTLDDVGIAISH